MKKVLFILVSIVFLALGTSCKTKQVNTGKLRVEQKENVDYSTLLNYLQNHQSTKQLSESEIKAFMQAFNSLNVQYDGKNIEDKLNVLMQKTDQGTQMTLSGIGKVNYTEENKKMFESFEKRMFARQDSIASVQLDEIQSLRSDLYTKIDSKQKQVDSKTFTPGMWITIIVTVIVMLGLTWLKNQFKPYLKAFKTSKEIEV